MTPGDRAARSATAQRVLPQLEYPDLPVSERRDDIAAAIAAHQVVIVAGETGSGKTTQLPKICLQLGRGVEGRIGHTQPRRIAARSVAERVSEELGTPLGDAIGYQVRFTERAGPGTVVKVMTDGVLLAEIQRDRLLRRYDTLIVDEAHERSLTIDFLLGYLKAILPQRPDLKVIVTSATIDTERFARHFAGADGVPAPIVAVSGRTYPVALRYRPYGAEGEPGDDRDQVQAVIEAVAELSAEGPGDVLVFLSGEREIRDTADALTAAVGATTEILPLYSRLSAAEQHRVFEPHSGRRVVLATNVAETSLTVPGVRYVVDPGTARISRYSHRSKVQRLPIEAISQASANQRAGRCGRVADGIAVRLYAEADFAARPEFTEPEILRTNLASVILSMTALGLGDIAGFPFLEPPDRRAIRDGVELLHELGALEPHAAATGARITDLGRSLAALPLDPRLGRMVIEGDRLGCLEQVLIVTAALSIQDPRERPTDKAAQADQLHARFRDPTSDFASYLRLWDYLGEQQESLSGNQFRRLCGREYLHYLRVREWQDVHAQLRRTCRELRLGRSSAPGDGERLHTALLAGLLAHVGAHDGERRDYLGARGRRFVIHPGSGLARKPPPFVVAAELVETSRLFARVVARVDPRWVEQVAGELVTRRYSEPRWSRRRAGVVATEKVSLYGVPLVAGRSVPYARVDPVACRELFLRHALVLGDWDAHHAFLRVNEALVREAGELEERTRRRDLLTDEEVLVDFFDARVPASVTGGRAFDRWWKTERRTRPDLLTYPRELLLPDPDDDLEDDFPRVWTFGDSALPDLPLAYAFEPGTAHDGVSVEVPLGLLPQLSAQDFLRQVPGRREEVVTALVRSLPKVLRTRFVPVPDTVRAVLPELAGDRPLPEALATALTRLGGVAVPVEALDPDSLPDHLRVTFRVVDEAGRQVGQGRDLAVLTHELAPVLRSSLAASAPELEQTGLTRFPADALPERVSTTVGGHEVTGYPALVDRGRHVDLVVLTAPDEQSLAMVGGIRRLLLLALPSPLKAAVAGLDTRSKLALGHTPYDDVPTMLADVVSAAVDALVHDAGTPRDPAAFELLLARVRAGLVEEVDRALRVLAALLAAAAELRSGLDALTAPVAGALVADLRGQLAELLPAGFVSAAGVRRLPDLLRYLRAAARRLDRAPKDLARDAVKAAEVGQVQAAVDAAAAAHPAAGSAQLQDLRWQVQELRVSLFAQGIPTAGPVSSTRILKSLAALP